MVTLNFMDEDVPFIISAIRARSNDLLESVLIQVDIQRKIPMKSEPFPPSEINVEAPPVEATVTPKRRGRPKGRKDSVKRRSPKSGVAK
jgi:hypothetical protein